MKLSQLSKKIGTIALSACMVICMLLPQLEPVYGDNRRTNNQSWAFLVTPDTWQDTINKYQQGIDQLSKADETLEDATLKTVAPGIQMMNGNQFVFDDFAPGQEFLKTMKEKQLENNKLNMEVPDSANYILGDVLSFGDNTLYDSSFDEDTGALKYLDTKIEIQPLLYKATFSQEMIYGTLWDSYDFELDAPAWKGQAVTVDLPGTTETEKGGLGYGGVTFFVENDINKIVKDNNLEPGLYFINYKLTRLNADKPGTNRGEMFRYHNEAYHITHGDQVAAINDVEAQTFKVWRKVNSTPNTKSQVTGNYGQASKPGEPLEITSGDDNEVYDTVSFNKSMIDKESGLTVKTEIYALDENDKPSAEPVSSLTSNIVKSNGQWEGLGKANVEYDNVNPERCGVSIDIGDATKYLPYGKYVVFEKIYVEGAEDEPLVIHQMADDPAQQLIVGEAASGRFLLQKVDADNEKLGLEGAEFDYYKKVDGKEFYVGKVKSGADGRFDIKAGLGFISKGEIILKETKAPATYEKKVDEIRLTFTVPQEEGKDVTLNISYVKDNKEIEKQTISIADSDMKEEEGNDESHFGMYLNKIIPIKNWKMKNTVTFMAETSPGNWEQYAQVTVPNGESIATPKKDGVSMPADPKLKGYVFRGWYDDKNGAGNEFTDKTVVNQDMTVYANMKLLATPVNLAPDLTLKSVEIKAGTDYNLRDMIVSATDPEDGNLIDKVVMVSDGGFDKNKVGTYTVTFKVTDSFGISVTKSAKITVVADDKPVPDRDKPTPGKNTPDKTTPPVVTETTSKVPQTSDDNQVGGYIAVTLSALLVLCLAIRKKIGAK